MTPRNEKEEGLFDQASQKPPGPEREAFLDQACGADKVLRQRLQALLQAHDNPATKLEPEATLVENQLKETISLSFPAEEGEGTRIGRYKLLQKIGEGGMGVVYMAEQEEPVRRRVALKIIKLGMDTKAVVARFEAERQALAMMDHPNIARVLDGGATETGRPYFVMELVQGVPLTEFCDKNKLPAQERLKLFLPICAAIQSAHQKGVIHRDIKPSNVLVTINHGEPVPKVIDFGIAKATNQKLTEKTLFTNYGAMIGTPAYMSPEQAEMSSLDVDTRADVYSLGVLLYELLTGTTPFPEKRLRSLGYGEMQRVIMEEEPDRPSTRLSTLNQEDRTTVLKNRGSDLAGLGRALKGDLDWVVMKCLEKDRRRRYETANGLASDVQRHLKNEPVTARPPSAAYRFQKAVRRNRVAALAATAVCLILLVSLIFSTAAYFRERQARLAKDAAEKAKEKAQGEAQVETVRANDVATFVGEYFSQTMADLVERGDGDATRRLLGIADKLASTLSHAPLAAARVRYLVGEGYSSLLDHGRAKEEFLSLQNMNLSGEEGEQLARIAQAEKIAASMWENWDTNAASELTLIGSNAMSTKPPDADVALVALQNASLFYAYSGVPEEAERLAREALRLAGDDPGNRMLPLDILAAELANSGKALEADKVGAELLSLVSAVQADALRTGNKKDVLHLVNVLTLYGLYSPDERLLREALPQVAEGTRLHVTLQTMLGAALARKGDWAAAILEFRACATNALCSVQDWKTAASLATLMGDRDFGRQLCDFGMAHYGARSDYNASRMLAEGLLQLQPDRARLPLIRELLERPLKVTTSHVWAEFPLAQLELLWGRLPEASAAIDRYLRSVRTLAPLIADQFEARGWFLCAQIEMASNHPEKAREAYQHGLRLHSGVWRSSGISSKIVEWDMVVDGEMFRREAAKLLGEPVSAAP
jgi:hypothetical protein